MQKSVIKLLVFGIIIVILIGGANAALFGNDEEDDSTTDDSVDISSVSFSDTEGASKAGIISSAKKCMNDLLNDKDSEDIGLDDAIFATLAVGSKNNLKDKINDEKGTEGCWPKAGCKLKETSQVLLSGEGDREDIKDWISGKNSTVNNLNWYLQMDIQNHIPSECTIKYDTQARKINVEDDLTLTGNPGTCLEISENGYWLKVKRSCQDKEYEISCDESFFTSILYQKSSGGAVFVSPQTQSSSGKGTTKETISGKCLSSGSSCDYEGSLWGALALHKSGTDISDYIPYLVAFSDDNTRFFPGAFLNILTGGDDYYGEVIQNHNPEGFWQMTGTLYNRYYDTGMGLLSLSGTNAQEIDLTTFYLGDVQGEEGCWNNNNLRDTGMLIWGLTGLGGISGGGGGGGSTVSCGNAGYSCEGSNACLDAGGNVLNNYDCSAEGFGKVCCDVNVVEASCSDKGGIVCSASQDCQGGEVSSSDGSCCLDACIDIVEEDNECEIGNGICSFSCDSGEEESSLECGSSGKTCCIEEEGGINILLIIVLVILIALIALGIWQRNRIMVWWHRRRGKMKSTPVTRAPPKPPMYSAARPPARRQVMKRSAPKDNELSDTLKKLREMAG